MSKTARLSTTGRFELKLGSGAWLTHPGPATVPTCLLESFELPVLFDCAGDGRSLERS